MVSGNKGGKPKTVGWELIDYYDADQGISAMERTTGYSLSITGQMQARGEVKKGVNTPDECMPAKEYIDALAGRGIKFREL
jgi:lysine 6-dehydrogenase